LLRISTTSSCSKLEGWRRCHGGYGPLTTGRNFFSGSCMMGTLRTLRYGRIDSVGLCGRSDQSSNWWFCDSTSFQELDGWHQPLEFSINMSVLQWKINQKEGSRQWNARMVNQSTSWEHAITGNAGKWRVRDAGKFSVTFFLACPVCIRTSPINRTRNMISSLRNILQTR
jgi:hypothetical protein